MAIKLHSALSAPHQFIQEKGNSIIEFISFLLLAILPIFTFFSWMTAESNQRLKDEEMFHEVIRIVKSGDVLSQSVGVANRYLTLHNSHGALFVTCLYGDCPRRGSRIQIRLINGPRTLETTFDGGQWT
jgi:hypothetical protein